MSESNPHTKTRGSGIKIGSVFGISIVLDWSLLAIALIIASSVALGPLATWHPDWSRAMLWFLGAIAAVLLFSSILIHEFSHALMARHYRIEVDKITLFIFGGMAHIQDEPPHWRAELLIAIVGPITSIVLGVIFLVVAGLFVDSSMVTDESVEQLFTRLNPAATLLLWMGNVNIVLALFNLVPAFPLDGGRVLRAVVWGLTGSLTKATKRAAAGGQMFGWLLIAVGMAMILGIRVPVFGTGLFGGLWICFIGWFLYRTALASLQQTTTQAALNRVRVSELMRSDFKPVSPQLTIDQLVDNYLLVHSQRGFPVVVGERLVGIISIDDIRRVPKEQWGETSVEKIMTPEDQLITLDIDADSFKGLSVLSTRGINQVPILDHNHLVGLLQREDILRWLQLYGPDQSGG